MEQPIDTESGNPAASNAPVRREEIRNMALIAHVDHGKTTLVDAILRQTRAHRKFHDMGELILDSMELELERGITIRA